MVIISTSFRVRYAETDAMGIVHHSSYIVWFEEGRSHYMRQVGFPYSRVERLGYYFTVVEVHARYVKPARYDEKVIVDTWISELKSRGLTFSYRVRRSADGMTLAEGYSRHVCITHDGKTTRIPDELRALLIAGAS